MLNMQHVLYVLTNGTYHRHMACWLGFGVLQHTMRKKLHLTLDKQGTCDAKLTKIPKHDFIFARVKTGRVGT